MRSTLLPCGDAAVLVEVDGTAEVLALHAALSATPPDDVVDLVPAVRTVLVRVRPGSSLDALRARVRAVADAASPSDAAVGTDEAELVVPTVYDGADLDEVAELTGLSAREVVTAHTGTCWRVAFSGFMPGFAYLGGGDPRLVVARRSEPRTRVPAGAVGLAGEFSGIYPRESPGGWQLLGRTELETWVEDRDPPALLTPGRVVRFEDAR